MMLDDNNAIDVLSIKKTLESESSYNLLQMIASQDWYDNHIIIISKYLLLERGVLISDIKKAEQAYQDKQPPVDVITPFFADKTVRKFLLMILVVLLFFFLNKYFPSKEMDPMFYWEKFR